MSHSDKAAALMLTQLPGAPTTSAYLHEDNSNFYNVKPTKRSPKKCNFYNEVKKLKNGEAKIFICDCNHHKGCSISVTIYDGMIRQVK